MSKNRGRKRKKSVLQRYEELPATPARHDRRRTMLVLLGSSVVLFGIYLAAWMMQDTRFYPFSMAVTAGYHVLLAVLFLAFVVINRGVSRDIPTPEQLSDRLSAEEKQAFIQEIRHARDRARPLLFVILPLLFLVGFDIVYTMFFA